MVRMASNCAPRDTCRGAHGLRGLQTGASVPILTGMALCLFGTGN